MCHHTRALLQKLVNTKATQPRAIFASSPALFPPASPNTQFFLPGIWQKYKSHQLRPRHRCALSSPPPPLCPRAPCTGLTDAATQLFCAAVAVVGGCRGVNPTNTLHPFHPLRQCQVLVKMPHQLFQTKVTDLPAPAIPLLFPGRFHASQPCHVLVTSSTLPQPVCLPLGVSAPPTARLPSLFQ